MHSKTLFSEINGVATLATCNVERISSRQLPFAAFKDSLQKNRWCLQALISSMLLVPSLSIID
jgi:hypothetical protein